jgi:anti-sigma B factor antagonist
MMQLAQETRSGWCVVAVRGRADAEAAHELEEALRTAVETNPRVAMNCVGLSYISSAGLRAVLQGARAAQEKGVEFTVCAPTPSVKKVFDMSGMHHVIHIQEGLPC